MSSFKDQMIANYERGLCSYSGAYDYTREQHAGAADMARLRAKEGRTGAEGVRPSDGALGRQDGSEGEAGTLRDELP